MYYVTAEKKRTFLGTWKLQHFVFDTKRRHLYYGEICCDEEVSPKSMLSQQYQEAVGRRMIWKKKLKVNRIVLAAHVHEYMLSDPHVKERDFFVMDVYGATRSVENGPPMDDGLLLDLSSQGDNEITEQFMYERLRDQFAFLQRERERLSEESLLRSTSESQLSRVSRIPSGGQLPLQSRGNSVNSVTELQDNVMGRRFGSTTTRNSLSHSLGHSRAGSVHTAAMPSSPQHPSSPAPPITEEGSDEIVMPTSPATANDSRANFPGSPNRRRTRFPRTISSPVKYSELESDRVWSLRCLNERDFRQFVFLLKSVLGYDGLCTRPHEGLPPHDPRNGISFASVPLPLWWNFKDLEDSVLYLCERGELVGVDSTGQLCVTIADCYLCITHDMVFLARPGGTIPRWVMLKDVAQLHYNTTGHRPFVAFLTDGHAPDIVFIPIPPLYAKESATPFNTVATVKKVRETLYKMCNSTLCTRRVIEIVERSDVPSARAFCTVQGAVRPFKWRPQPGFLNILSSPICKTKLAALWQDVIRQQRQLSANTREGGDTVRGISLRTDFSSSAVDLTNPESFSQRPRRIPVIETKRIVAVQIPDDASLTYSFSQVVIPQEAEPETAFSATESGSKCSYIMRNADERVVEYQSPQSSVSYSHLYSRSHDFQKSRKKLLRPATRDIPTPPHEQEKHGDSETHINDHRSADHSNTSSDNDTDASASAELIPARNDFDIEVPFSVFVDRR